MDAFLAISSFALWRAALAAAPAALLVSVLCRVLPLRPATRHSLWFTVLVLLFLPGLAPSLRIPGLTTGSQPANAAAISHVAPSSNFGEDGLGVAENEIATQAPPVENRAWASSDSHSVAHHVASNEPVVPVCDSANPAVGHSHGDRIKKRFNASVPSLPQSHDAAPKDFEPVEIAHSEFRAPARLAQAADSDGRSFSNPGSESQSWPRFFQIVRIAPLWFDEAVKANGMVLSESTAEPDAESGGAILTVHADRAAVATASPIAERTVESAFDVAVNEKSEASEQKQPVRVIDSAVATTIQASLVVFEFVIGVGRTYGGPIVEAGKSALRWFSRLQRAGESLLAVPPLPTSIWATGSALVLIYFVIRSMQFGYALKKARPVDARSARLISEAARELGLSRVPSAVMMDAKLSPMIWCGRRLQLVLPIRLWSQLDHGGRKAVIIHELAHILRRDHWVCRLDLILRCVYWWHPVAWWIRHRLEDEADASCDAWVTWLHPRERRAYADALLTTRRFIGTGGAAPISSVAAMSGRARRFGRRLTMVMTVRTKPGRTLPGILLAAVLGIGGWLISPAHSCPPDETSADASTPQLAPESPASVPWKTVSIVAPTPPQAPTPAAEPCPATRPTPTAAARVPRAVRPPSNRKSNGGYVQGYTIAPAPPLPPAAPNAATMPRAWPLEGISVIAMAPQASDEDAETFRKHMRNRKERALESEASGNAPIARNSRVSPPARPAPPAPPAPPYGLFAGASFPGHEQLDALRAELAAMEKHLAHLRNEARAPRRNPGPPMRDDPDGREAKHTHKKGDSAKLSEKESLHECSKGCHGNDAGKNHGCGGDCSSSAKHIQESAAKCAEEARRFSEEFRGGADRMRAEIENHVRRNVSNATKQAGERAQIAHEHAKNVHREIDMHHRAQKEKLEQLHRHRANSADGHGDGHGHESDEDDDGDQRGDDKSITRKYSLPKGKLDAFTALMSREDVPVLVTPSDDAIEVRGTRQQHRAIQRFVDVIHPESGPRSERKRVQTSPHEEALMAAESQHLSESKLEELIGKYAAVSDKYAALSDMKAYARFASEEDSDEQDDDAAEDEGDGEDGDDDAGDGDDDADEEGDEDDEDSHHEDDAKAASALSSVTNALASTVPGFQTGVEWVRNHWNSDSDESAEEDTDAPSDYAEDNSEMQDELLERAEELEARASDMEARASEFWLKVSEYESMTSVLEARIEQIDEKRRATKLGGDEGATKEAAELRDHLSDIRSQVAAVRNQSQSAQQLGDKVNDHADSLRDSARALRESAAAVKDSPRESE